MYCYMKRFKYINFVFKLSLATILLLYPSISSAHEAVSDGAMTVTMHIEPHDGPTLAEPQVLHFFFDDANTKFVLSNCNCMLSLSSSDGVAVKRRLDYENQTAGSLNYTFRKPEQYRLVLHGEPLAGGGFMPFTVTFAVGIVPDPGSKILWGLSGTDFSIIFGFTGTGLILLIMVGGYLVKEWSRTHVQ